MYELIQFFGPAAITYSIIYTLIQRKRTGVLEKVIEWVAYAFINVSLTVCLLEPFGKIQLLTGGSAMPHVVYGPAGLIVSGAIAVVLGVVLAVLYTRLTVKLEHDVDKEVVKDEEKM